MKYASFYFKGGLKITGLVEDVKVIYNPILTGLPTGIKIIPLESIWTGSIHIVTRTSVRFSLWDLEKVVLVEDYLATDSKVLTFLKIRQPKARNFYEYWKKVAHKLETLQGES